MKRSGIACGALLLAFAFARPFAVQPPPRLALELQDYAALPITADNTDANTRAQLARVNYLRDEPSINAPAGAGGRRFFVNGYRIPNDNPFVTVEGARKEIWAYGLRNPHRLAWDVDPATPRTATLLAFNIGLVTWETVVVIHKGANYGYPLREGTQSMSPTNGMGPLPESDTIPVQISDTVARGTVKPTYPVIQYPPQSRYR